MGWLILPVLILPFVFYGFRKRLWARLGFALIWLPCAGFAWYFFREAAQFDADLQTVHRYELRSEPGDHTIEVNPLSQYTMLGVLQGGEGKPRKKDLERLKWTGPEKSGLVWFDVGEHEPVAPDETPLFRGYGEGKGPIPIRYHVDADNRTLLVSRALLVRHDSSAIHMLRDHAASPVGCLAWALTIWGTSWFVVHVAVEVAKIRRPTVETPGAA